MNKHRDLIYVEISKLIAKTGCHRRSPVTIASNTPNFVMAKIE